MLAVILMYFRLKTQIPTKIRALLEIRVHYMDAEVPVTHPNKLLNRTANP